jgi:Uma2 family endonuclease
MGYPNKILPYYTYEDYCRWEGQWELIEGIPYAMSPMPRPEHQTIAGNLHAELRYAIKKAQCSCKVYQPIDYKITEDTILNPDLLIVCKPITKQFLDFAPELVVEILSPATALKDRHTKFEIYQQQQIPYYIMVDTDKKQVEVWQLNEAGKFGPISIDEKQPQLFAFNACLFSIVFENIWS